MRNIAKLQYNCVIFRITMIPGPAQLKLVKSFVPSLATYGACAGTLVLFFASEWKAKELLKFIPLYNR